MLGGHFWQGSGDCEVLELEPEAQPEPGQLSLALRVAAQCQDLSLLTLPRAPG